MHADTTSAIRARLIAAMEERAAGLAGEARSALEARLAERKTLGNDAPDPATSGHGAPRPALLFELIRQLAGERSPARDAYPEVPALADFRQRWSTLRVESQLQQSVAHAPTHAGPLNSSALASRAIGLMRAVSPGYLRSFLAYIDDLAWLDQLQAAGTAPRSGEVAPRKRARRKPQA